MKIPWAAPYFWGKEKEYVNAAIDSTWISEGPFVKQLEADFAKFVGTTHGIALANGTATLFLALKAAGIGAGDEVIVPGYGFVAAVNMVMEVGAKPIFCDVDIDTWLMDPIELEKVVTPKTRAIIPIHTYGNVCAMAPINAIAEKHRLIVIEDAAESIFSRYQGKYAGALGDINSFSFQTTKTITCGEGGILTTNRDDFEKTIRLLRSHGMGRQKYWHETVAYNFRLTNLQAAVACAQLEYSTEIIEGRQNLFEKFVKRLANLEGVNLQMFERDVQPVVWALGLFVDQDFSRLDRDDLISAFAEKGIECRPGFYTCNQMPYYRGPYLEKSDLIARRLLSLPFHLALTETEVDYICKTLVSFKR